MPLYLSEDDVGRLLTVPDCIEAVETAFRDWAAGRADNRPRARAAVPGALLHSLSAASEPLGRMAAKVYATTRSGARFVVLLFDARSADLLAILEADRLGQVRTGAASGVATRHLARADARVLGILGTGWQARSQVLAVGSVRRLESIRAYGRDPERLKMFCREMSEATGLTAARAPSAEAAVRGADIVVTATSSAAPILMGSWLAPGTHVNAVGSNRADRRELDDEAVRRADPIAVDSLEQARLEAGDLIGRGLDRAVELKEILAGHHPGRSSPSGITLFKSLGIGLEDLAAASRVYDLALQAGAGRTI
jgi:alanine dehydrogenase